MADIMKVEEMPILLRREVEARILKPFLEAFEKEVGKERTKEIVIDVIKKAANEEGRIAAECHGGNTLKDLEEITGHHSEGGALTIKGESPAPNQLLMTTLKCEYVEMYERLGMKEWGCLLSCLRDEEYFKGINSDFNFERTQVLMTGGTCCDSLVIDTKGE